MDTAVTGASGHIGANLVRSLLEKGEKVRVLVREDQRALDGLNVEKVRGDISNIESLRKLLKGVKTLYHAAGRISLNGSDRGLVDKINIEGTRNVVETCLSEKVKKMVHFSSIHAFSSDPNDKTIDETRELVGENFKHAYDRSKAMGQMEVMKGVEKGLDAVVVNPTGVIGPYDYKISNMGSVLMDLYHQRMPALVNGGYNWVDVRDVTFGAIAAAEKGKTGECYLLAGHWKNQKTIARVVSEISGNKPPKFILPTGFCHFAAHFSVAWANMCGKTPRFTPYAVETVKSHRHISHNKASTELGYNPRPFETTVSDTIEWFEKSGMLRTET